MEPLKGSNTVSFGSPTGGFNAGMQMPPLVKHPSFTMGMGGAMGMPGSPYGGMQQMGFRPMSKISQQ